MQIGEALLEQLAEQAARSPRRRQHFNLHSSYDEHCQRLLNILWHDSYIAPHRHSLDPKDETLVALRGEFGCVLFADDGSVTSQMRLTANGAPMVIIVTPRDWHTLVALTETAVLLEVKAGPFDPLVAKEPAPWAAAEGSPEAPAYLAALKRLFR